MGPEQAAMLVNFVGSMDDAMLDTMKTTEKAQKSLGKLAKEGFSTGRTLQESYDMAKDAAIASFRSIGHARESFVKDSAKQFAELSKTLKELAAKGGPMGMVIEKMADMHAIGVKALLPEALRPMAAVMGEMIGEAVPLAGALGSLGFRLGMLFSPFGIILAALTVFGVLLMDARMKTKSWGEALEMTLKRVAEYFQKFKEFALKALDQVLNYLVNFTDDLAKRAKEMDWKKFFQNLFAKVGGALRSAAGAIKDAIGMLWGAITGGLDGESGPAKSRVGKILQNLISVFKNVFSGLFAALKDVDWSASLQAIMSALSAAFAGANKLLKKIPFKEIFGALFDGLGKVLDVLGSEQVGSFLGNLVQSILERGSILIDAIVMLLETGLDKLTNMNLADKLGKVVENALSIILGALEGLIPLVGKILEKLPGLLRKAFDLIIELVKTIPARVGEILKGLGPKLGPLLGKLITILLDFLWEIPGLLKDLVVKLVTSLPDILKGLATLVEGALSLLQDLLINALDAIKEWLIKKFPSAAGPITAVFDGIKKAIQFVFKVVKWFIDGVKKGFQILWDFVKKVWDFLFGDNGIVKVYFQTVFTIISDILSWFVEAWKVAYDFVKAQVENVLGFVGAMWDWIGKVVGTIVEFIYTFVKERYDAVQKVITDVLKAVGKAWDTLKTAVEDIIKGFKDKIDTAFKAIQKTVEDAMKAAGKAWEDFKTVVKDIMDWVEKKALESFKKITDALDGATKKVKEFFIGAEKGAEDTFGNSIHTWVEGDMEKTTKAFDDAGNTIVKAMSTQMHDAVVEALGKAFDEAFKKAAKKTQKFTDDEMVIFNKFLDKLVKAWTDAWRTIVLNTEAAALLINNAVEKVSTSLAATIASYQQAISLRKEADRLAKTSEAETGSSETTPLDASLETLIKVTNEPAWFFGPEGWVEITARNQLALIEVLKSIANAIGKASPAQSGNVAEARRQLGLGPGKGPGGAMPGGRR
jgi:phage-related protein